VLQWKSQKEAKLVLSKSLKIFGIGLVSAT